jgi:hypothetical protein
MSKRNEALEALTRAKPVSPPPAIVETKPQQPIADELFDDAPAPASAPATIERVVKAAAPTKLAVRKTVANSAARSMLYLPPKAKRKFKEIAFHENRKEHDVYVEALREYLERRGHRGLL